MEKLDVFDCSNVFIASYFTNDRDCAHCNREHTLIYIHSGELEITERNRKTILRPGDCAFMRRDNRMWLQKRVGKDQPYDIRSLFESVIPYFDAGMTPSDEILKLKMTEGIYAILNTDVNLYASLFDFVDPWKIDIMEFMEKNYMNELSMEEMAYYTGRSLSTFKRDFRQYSDLTPQKWLIQRRLQAAHELIRKGGKKVSEICFDVGFKNLSHFSKVYKEAFGVAPTEHER